MHRIDGQDQAPTASGHIARAQEVEIGVQAHLTYEGQKRMLQMEGRRRKVLKQATGEVQSQGRRAKAATGRSASANIVVDPAVPMSHWKCPPWGSAPGRKMSSWEPTRAPASDPWHILGHGFDRLQVLGSEPWRVASSPDMGQVHILARESRQWDAKADDSTAARKTAAIKMQHTSYELLLPLCCVVCSPLLAQGEDCTVLETMSYPGRHCNS